MTRVRGPVAPIVSGSEELAELPRLVLEVLRERQRQHAAGLVGLASAAVTRGELVRRVRLQMERGVSDRAVRNAVETLRRSGHPVVSDSQVAGYWLSTDPAEIRDCAERTYMGRIRRHAGAARGLLRAASAVQAQPEKQGALL